MTRTECGERAVAWVTLDDSVQKSVAFKELYEEIAPLYHLVHADWEASIAGQAAALDAVFCTALGTGPFRVLDISCGIGTQALGLAQLGHRVTASDASPAAVARARREARARGLAIDFAVADMRVCHEQHGGPFDVVLSADNSVPHLLTDADILMAFRSAFERTRPGGITVLTVRDYEREDRSPHQLRPFGIRETEDGRYLVLQAWDFEGEHYDVTMYFLRETPQGHELTVGRSRYYAIGTDRLLTLLREAGFAEAERRDDCFFQPLLVARRSSESE